MEFRTRFAPSPTGYLHVGGVRTALFAWLAAKRAGGQFILRIEDTDKTREVAGAQKHIEDSLSWVGIDWDEGPDKGGPYAPYKQSERLDIYRQWAQKLVDGGRAYADPYSIEELADLRDQAKQNGRPFLFRDHRPDRLPAWDGSQPLRFKSEPKNYSWHDEVLGDLKSGPATIDDFILMKADGYPTYNFCHIIDDYLMRISHVIRSQEFISSVPKYLNLHEALDLRAPKMATLPYVMAIDGRRKLSKRDGAKDILDYAKAGYLPEAMLNFLATLGWNDGTEQEIFSKAELISKFNLSRVQKAAARFDERRLLWMNGHWLRHLSLDQLFERAMTFWPAAADNFDASYKKQVLSLAQDRLKTLSELEALTGFFFEEPKANPELLSGNPKLSHLDKPLLIGLLQSAHQRLSGCSFYTDDLPNALNQLLSETGQTPAVLFSLIRIATTWAPASPGLSESLKLLGKERSLNRLQQAIDLLSEVSPVSS